MTLKDFLTVKEAAEYLAVDRSWIIKLIHQGDLDAEMQDVPVRYYLIPKASLDSYKNSPKDKGGRPKKGE